MPKLKVAAAFAYAAIMVLCIGSTPSVAADPYEINAILSLTGQAAFLGQEQAKVLNVIETQVNASGGVGGRPIKFVLQDDQTSPQTAVQSTQALIAKNVPFILGPTLISTCNAMAALAVNGPVIYCTSPNEIPANDTFVFSAGQSTRDFADAMMRFAREHGLRRIAWVYTTDAGGASSLPLAKAALAEPGNEGLSLVATESFNVTDVSVAAQIAKVKAAQPQLVVIWTAGTPFGTFLHAFNDSGLDVPVMSPPSNATYAAMTQWSTFLPKAFYFATSPPFAANAVKDATTRRAIDSFLNSMKSVGIKADSVHATVWDSTWLLIAALRKYGPSVQAMQVRDYLVHLNGWVGSNGPYDFAKHPSRGLGLDSVYIARWDAAHGGWTGVSGPGGAK